MPGDGPNYDAQHRAPHLLVGHLSFLKETLGKTAASAEGLRTYLGIASGIGSILLAALNLLDRLLFTGVSLTSALSDPSIALLLLFGLVWVATGLLRYRFLAWVQVAIFAFIALFIAIVSNPGNVTSAPFLILAIILISEYGESRTAVIVVVPTVFALYAVALFVGYHAYTPDWVLSTVASLILVVLLLVLYGTVLARHWLQHQKEAALLETRVKERTADLERALSERVVMLQEIHHRVKNNLQIVASLLRLEANKLEDAALRSPMEASIQRIHAMALVHETLYQNEELQYVLLADYARELVSAISAAVVPAVRFELLSDNSATVDLDFAVPFGLLLNELITNAVEHAFEGRAPGTIRVRLRLGELLELQVEDDGIGLAPEELDAARGSLGLTLVHSLVAQLAGAIELRGRPGTRWHVEVPLAPRAQAARAPENPGK